MHRIHYRFALVLGLILVTLAFQLAAPDGDWSRLVAVVLQAATLIAAVVASRAHRWVIRLAVLAAVLAVMGATLAIVGTDEFGNDSGRVVSLLLVALAPAAIVSGLRKHFREEGGITVHTMFGVLCIYLLVGMFFGTVFAVDQELSNRRFFTSGVAETSDFLYFSFSTLTTIGYGDFVAATRFGRSLAITEALIGQIYLVAVVGLIVSNLRPMGSSRRRRA